MALERNLIHVGDALAELRKLPTATVDSCVSSPPYYGLRDYQVRGQIGLEPAVDDWVEQLRVVCREIGRVLKPSGSLFLNVGDSYSRHPRCGAPAKSLLLGPQRLLLALAADGWILRNICIWSKTNPRPTSVADRFNATYAQIFFLVRSRRYYFSLDEVRQPHRSRAPRRARQAPVRPAGWAGPLAGSHSGLLRARAAGQPDHWLGKNPGDVWRYPSSNFRGAHFATFPEVLVERPLLASCPAAVCVRCQAPWQRRVVDRTQGRPGLGPLQAACRCRAPSRPGVVLDPFFGAGTVGVVAQRLGRDWVGIELNPDYAQLAAERIAAARPKLEIAA
jgi:site-specific DNA-methyltransferase (adenine-specific)